MPHRFFADEFEKNEIEKQLKGKRKMDLNKLVREKMKELEADHSGEYVDGKGKAFSMKKCEHGYTIGYGGGEKEIEVSTPQAHKLVAHCKKWEMAEDKKD